MIYLTGLVAPRGQAYSCEHGAGDEWTFGEPSELAPSNVRLDRLSNHQGSVEGPASYSQR
jgi:hypothetical protein